MGIAAYRALCIDAVDDTVMQRFWASALGLETAGDAENRHLVGPTPQHTVWVNAVPEPRTVKQRVHLDLNVASVQELRDLGATVLDETSFRWTVMADPEGGELCAFVRDEAVTQRLYEIAVDCVEPAGIATWWAELLGARVVHDERGFSYVEDIPGAPFDSLDFVPVPEAKTVKNRIHLDLDGDPEEVLAHGATLLRARDEEIGWHVMADPEGNELCVFEK